MPVSYDEVRELLQNETLARVEFAIAEGVGSDVNRDHLETTVQFTLQEIGLSALNAEQLRLSFDRDCERIIEFGIAFLNDETATRDDQEYPPGEEPDADQRDKIVADEGLGVGFGITYLIYLHYLGNFSESDFCEYLRARRIPHHKQFARDLRRIYAQLIAEKGC